MEKNNKNILENIKEIEKNILKTWEEINNFEIENFSKNFQEKILEIKNFYGDRKFFSEWEKNEEKFFLSGVHDIWNIFLDFKKILRTIKNWEINFDQLKEKLKIEEDNEEKIFLETKNFIRKTVKKILDVLEDTENKINNINKIKKYKISEIWEIIDEYFLESENIEIIEKNLEKNLFVKVNINWLIRSLQNLTSNSLDQYERIWKENWEIKIEIKFEHNILKIIHSDKWWGFKKNQVNQFLLQWWTSKKDKKNHWNWMVFISNFISENNWIFEVWNREWEWVFFKMLFKIYN